MAVLTQKKVKKRAPKVEEPTHTIDPDRVTEYIQMHMGRLNFWDCCLYYDPAFFESRPFLQEVADKFQWIIDEFKAGRPRKGAVSMPPRAGKSYITSLFCAFFLAMFPDKSVMRNSATATLYQKFSYDVRKIIGEKRFKRLFPAIKLSRDMKNVRRWNITKAKQVSYFGNGVSGQIVGFGANLAITDDLYPGLQEAMSEKYQEKVNTWKHGSHDSRKELACPEIYIGTRWTMNDVIGKAIDSGRLDFEIRIPAMYMKEDGLWYSFCEAVKSTQEYREIKEDTDEVIWAAEYMQDPIELEGLLFPPSSLQWYDANAVEVERLGEYGAAFIDPNAEGKDKFCAVGGKKIGQMVYVPMGAWICNNHDSDVNLKNTVSLCADHKMDTGLFEAIGAFLHFGKMAQGSLEQVFEPCDFRLIKSVGNKEATILQAAAFIRNRFKFPLQMMADQEGKAFIKQLTSYNRMGGNKHDDAADALAKLADHMQTKFNWYS